MENLQKVKSLLKKSFVIIWMLSMCAVFAAPAPIEGLKLESKQPDGTPIDVRFFGDDFFGYFATADGYTVIRNESDNFWYYAETSHDGLKMISTGKKAILNLPTTRGMSKRNLPSSEAIAKIRKEKYDKTYSKEYLREKLENKIQRLRNKGISDNELKPLLDKYRSEYMPATRTNSVLDVPNFAPPPSFTDSKIVGLVILVDFSDVVSGSAIDASKVQITNMLNEKGYSKNGHKGSLRDYYYHQSSGNVELTHVVNAYIRAPRTRAEYVKNVQTGGDMFIEDILRELRKSTTNISDIEKVTEMGINGERGIPLTFLFSGDLTGINWGESLWPHANYTKLKGQKLKGKKLCGYQMTDIGRGKISIGTMTHELGHLVFGFDDYYDYNADRTKSHGLGVHCLMAAGNNISDSRIPAPLSPYLKVSIGWAKEPKIIEKSKKQIFSLSSKDGNIIKYTGPKPTEYFLIEARDSVGDVYQQSLFTHLTATLEVGNLKQFGGISIWHIDELATAGTTFGPNEMQDRTSAKHYECSLEQADGRYDLENHRNGNTGDYYDYFSFIAPSGWTNIDNKREFSANTTPNSKWWDNSISDLHLTNMKRTNENDGIYELTTVVSTTMSVSPLNFIVGVEAGYVEATVKNEGIGSFTWDSGTLPDWIDRIEDQDGNELGEEKSTTIKIYYNAATDTGIIRSGRINFSANPTTIKNSTAAINIVQRLDVLDPMDDFISGANLLTLTTPPTTTQELTIGNGDNVDWFKFELTKGTNYLFESSSSTSVDVRAELYGPDQKTLLTKDDDGGTEFKQFKVAYTPTETGIYYLKVLPYINAYGIYQISFSEGLAPKLEIFPNNFSVKDVSASKVFTITSSKEESFSIEKEKSSNWVSVTPSSGNLTAGVPTKITVTFEKNMGNKTRTGELSITVGKNQTSKILLNQMGLIPVGDTFDPEDDKIGKATEIKEISKGGKAERFIGNGDNVDWFRFNLTKNEKYRFYSTSETNVDIRAELFRQKPVSEGGALVSVASDDDSLSLQFNIIHTVAASEGGTYYLKITPYNAFIYGNYTLNYSQFKSDASLSAGEMIISSKNGNINTRGTTKSFVISNIGEETFAWNISEKPDWVNNIYPTSGKIAPGVSEIVNYSCDNLAENSITRTGKIIISSDTPNVIGAPKTINILQNSQMSDENTNSIVYNIKKGWNLISVPLINPDMTEFKKICDQTFWVWENNNYQIVADGKNSEYLKAFWICANSDSIITLNGERIPSMEVELISGWNLYGPTENMILSANIETIFSWDPAGRYEEPAGSLLEGKGYWIFVPENTFITL